jgi:hypothetical protein
MLKSIYKKPRASPRAGGPKVHRSEVYNQTEDECRWPYNVFGQVAECEFRYEVLEKTRDYWVVKVPKETVLYHSTQVLGGKHWWTEVYPLDSAHGGVWFTSTDKHALNFTTKTHILVYLLKEEATLLFVRNLTSFGENVRGYEFVSRYYAPIKDQLREQGYQIQGYLSCNECEVFIENDEIPKVLLMEPALLSQRSSAFID